MTEPIVDIAITETLLPDEAVAPTMAETLIRLEAKLNEICEKLDARPTHAEMNMAIETKVETAKLDVTGLLNDRVTTEQAQTLVDEALEPIVQTVSKLTETIDRVTTLHEQSGQRIEKLYEMVLELAAALKQQGQDVEGLEDAGRDRDLVIAQLQADNKSDRQRLKTVYNTVLPHNGDGGLLAQTQTMHKTVVNIQEDLEDIKPTIDELDKDRAQRARREERRRAFVRSRSGASSIGLTAAWLVGNWAGLIDGNLIGLVIKFYIGAIT